MYREVHKITEIHRNIQRCTEKNIFYFRQGKIYFKLVYNYKIKADYCS